MNNLNNVSFGLDSNMSFRRNDTKNSMRSRDSKVSRGSDVLVMKKMASNTINDRRGVGNENRLSLPGKEDYLTRIGSGGRKGSN